MTDKAESRQGDLFRNAIRPDATSLEVNGATGEYNNDYVDDAPLTRQRSEASSVDASPR